MHRIALLPVAVLLFVCTLSAAQPPTPALRVVSAGPTGEVANAAEANEIRVVFSEPMVALAQVSSRVRPAFFHVSPAVAGTFRWSGTTVLIFTPARRLPLATAYSVTIDAGAKAVSGRTLAAPYTFSFTTPTARLLRTNWYRPNGRYDAAPIVVLHFNQPVTGGAVLPHLAAHFQPHPFSAPAAPVGATPGQPVDPAALQAFTAKVDRARAAAGANTAVSLRLAADWDKKRFPPNRETVVVEITSPVPPDGWVRIEVDGQVPAIGGTAVSGKPQNYTIETAPTFFVNGFDCASECDPEMSNPIEFRTNVKATAFAKALTAIDVSDPRRQRAVTKAAPRKREPWEGDEAMGLSLEDGGYAAQPPDSRYVATLPADLQASDGQVLGYAWSGTVENWHQRAFTSFGDGHGVWETGGGAQLPFYARNFLDVKQWAAPVAPDQLMPTLRGLQASNFHTTPDVAAVERRLGGAPDKITSHGLDIARALTPSGTGLVWAAVEEEQPIARSKPYRDATEPATRATLVQVTNLGISVKDSPQNTLVFVTRLDNATPVPGARVSIVKPDGSTLWTGTTGADGVAIAPETRLRDPRKWYEFAFIVTAEKDGDVAYVGSDWNEGVQPWDFGMHFDLDEADPLLRGSVITDRGVYKLGEEVHLKAVLRRNTPSGVQLLPDGTSIDITTRDARNKVVDQRTIKVNAWSSAEWTLTLPDDGALGDYSVRVMPTAAAAKPTTPGPSSEEEDYSNTWKNAVNGSFLVAAYRRPDFRVDVTLSSDTELAGDPLKGLVTARYLFGAPMQKRPTHWALTRALSYSAPAAILDKFPEERWAFVGAAWDQQGFNSDVASNDATLTASGELPLSLDTPADAGMPITYTLEGDVEDVSRQHIANRSSILVHPAPFYIGVRRPGYFTDQAAGLKTDVVAVALDGKPVPGVDVTLTLTQIQWQSVRRAEGNGFYTWDTQRKEVPAGEWHVTTGADPVPFNAPLASGGLYQLTAKASSEKGRYTVTRTSFYALGSGYTAWQRYDHNRIDLVPERTTYKPGETARIMIQSPWEQATALVTTEREGIRTHRQFALTSTQQSIGVPITAADTPNVFVSVLLVKGRSKAPEAAKPATSPQSPEDIGADDPSDPGKPTFRLGYVELKVEDPSRHLTVSVKANKEEYRPANKASVSVDVKDRDGRGTQSELTLWAVDYGVLSLTNYKTPDVVDSVYVTKALQVLNEDNRQRIISRRVLTPKGATDGGGGGLAEGPGTVRRDFRVLAFWVGSLVTDSKGHATADVKLPESLTTYRIMAVAADRSSRFGHGETEIRINKPVTLKAAFPRFLAVGDKATFGAVVTNQLKAGGNATVTIASLDPSILQFSETASQKVDVGAGAASEVRFEAAGRAVGRARVRVTVTLNGESDAFEDIIPVEILSSPETVSAIGEATDTPSIERLKIPEGVVPGIGGLHVDLASTALVGLGDGARYLIEYPYGCAEQRSSRTLAMLLATDLGDAFTLPGIEPGKLRPAAQSSLRELQKFQCESGGFAYWPGACWSTSPYLTAYVAHVLKVATDLKYDVDKDVLDRAYTYLEQSLAQAPPENAGWWPSYTAWQAFAVKVLVEGGRNQDSAITRIYGYRERMPVFALAYLHDALVARGETSGPREADIRRRIANAILPEAATAHVEELSDPYLLWYWNSNIRSTAIVLNTLVHTAQPDMAFRPMVQWLLQARRDGRWGNTQENALALEALVSYYKTFEAQPPDFTATVTLGRDTLAKEKFSGRSAEARSTDLPMSTLQSQAPAGEQPLTFARSGSGTLFYSARLRYAIDALFQQGLDTGITVERTYAPYVENGTRPAATTFNAGDLVRVTLTLRLTKERRFVAVTDPLPAGFEPVESWFATSAQSLAKEQDDQGDASGSWFGWWQHGGFDHVERHDDRVELFATRLSEGTHTFTYVVRATTSGTFRTAPAHAEEMYEPEVFGRTATAVIDVKK